MHVYDYAGRRGGGLTWEFQAIVPGDPILSGEELVFVKHGIRGRQNVRDFEESVKGGETLLRVNRGDSVKSDGCWPYRLKGPWS